MQNVQDRVLMQVIIPRALRQRLRLLAVQRETSLRRLAREAFERLLAAEDGPGPEEGRRGRCDRQPTG